MMNADEQREDQSQGEYEVINPTEMIRGLVRGERHHHLQHHCDQRKQFIKWDVIMSYNLVRYILDITFKI